MESDEQGQFSSKNPRQISFSLLNMISTNLPFFSLTFPTIAMVTTEKTKVKKRKTSTTSEFVLAILEGEEIGNLQRFFWIGRG